MEGRNRRERLWEEWVQFLSHALRRWVVLGGEGGIGDGGIQEYCRGKVAILSEKTGGSPLPITVHDGDLFIETFVQKEHSFARNPCEALSRDDNDQDKNATKE